jgi:outer membrane lipase/esterase
MSHVIPHIQHAGQPEGDGDVPPTPTRLVVLGDGLSDSGRFGPLTHDAYPPSPPFHGGRWTNGPTWVETLASHLGWALDPADNLAQGGATTGCLNINEPLRATLQLGPDAPIRGVLAQAEALAERRNLDAAALSVIWAGGHDIGASFDCGHPDPFTDPPSDNIATAVRTLAAAGARRFLLPTMPDAGSTPAYVGTERAATATAICAGLNEGIRHLADALPAQLGIEVVIFDAAAVFAAIAGDPAAYGIRHVTEAYLPDDQIDFTDPLRARHGIPNDRIGVDADEFMWFWSLAAGRRVHDALAQAAADLLSEHFHGPR